MIQRECSYQTISIFQQVRVNTRVNGKFGGRQVGIINWDLSTSERLMHKCKALETISWGSGNR